MIRSIFLALLAFFTFGVQVSNAQPKITSEEFYIESAAPNIKLYVLNKYSQDKKNFSSDKTVLFVHGATYPSETAFDLDLPGGGSWMNYVAERGYDAYLVDVRGYGKSTRPPAMSEAPSQNPPFAMTVEAVQDVGTAIAFILKRRGLSKLNLVGWSWGTAIVGGYTSLNNAKIEKLVLYAPLWIPKAPLVIGALGAFRSINA